MEDTPESQGRGEDPDAAIRPAAVTQPKRRRALIAVLAVTTVIALVAAVVGFVMASRPSDGRIGVFSRRPAFAWPTKLSRFWPVPALERPSRPSKGWSPRSDLRKCLTTIRCAGSWRTTPGP